MIILQVSSHTTIGWRVNSIKPLGFYANLSVNIDTTELTQKELRELINSLALVLGEDKDTTPEWKFVLEPTNWVEQYWKILLEDPTGVIKWAADTLQSLIDANQGGAI